MNSGKTYDRVFFLSGLDYPLWSNSQICDFLAHNSDKEFIKGMNLSDCYKPQKMQTRVRQYHFRDLPLHSIIARKISCRLIRGVLNIMHIRKDNYIAIGAENFKVYCGSSWWCLSWKCLSHVYTMINTHKEFERYFKTCLAPDEMLVQTIVFNSEFVDKAILYEGEYPGLVGLTPLHYIEYDGQIRTYTEKDFEKLMHSGKMFVRKLQSGMSDGLIDKINVIRK